MIMVTLLSSSVSNIIIPVNIFKTKAKTMLIYVSSMEDCASQIVSYGLLEGHIVLFFELC